MPGDPRERTRPVVAIDGPAGSGKTTVARRVAGRLGYTLVDTGALYRCVALAAVRRGTDPGDAAGLAALAAACRVRFDEGRDEQRVVLDGEEVTRAIRQPAVSELASRVSALPPVRAALLGIQRDLGRNGGVVLEGRDIGTVVFPDAEVKVFLLADDDIRARRRFDELRARGLDVSLEQTRADMLRRDRRDAARDVAPMKPAPDAVVLDTGPLAIDEVVDRVIELVARRADGSRRNP